jgi:GNAT superfamily N-acetyltransferase
VSEPGVTFELLGGAQAAAHASELQVLHAEVCARDAAPFADRFLVQRRQPGFALAEARHGGYLVGYAFGMPLRPSTDWWRYLTTPLPDEVTTEHPGRTFALAELLVRASWRRQGIGRALHDLILADRPEERATLTVPPAAAPAQHAFRNWGWRKVARTRGEQPGSPVSDVLVTTLPAGPQASLVTARVPRGQPLARRGVDSAAEYAGELLVRQGERGPRGGGARPGLPRRREPWPSS